MNIKLKGDIKILPKKSIDLLPGFTVLIGCNGAGKTTLIDSLYTTCRSMDNVVCLSYNDRSDGGSLLISEFMCKGRMSDAAAMTFASEGERILIGLTQFLHKVKKALEDNPRKDVVILYDAVDSGMSLDVVKEFKQYHYQLLEKLKRSKLYNGRRRDVYIVVAANSYGMCKDELCFDVSTWKDYFELTYDDFETVIDKSRIRKDKRNKKLYEAENRKQGQKVSKRKS